MGATQWKRGWPVILLATAAIGLLGWRVGAGDANPLMPPRSPQPLAPMQVGMNLGMLNYWSQEFPFADIIDGAWIKVVRPDGWKDTDGLITLDAGGHPVGVPAGTTLAVIVKSGGGDRLPSGSYDCAISPGWSVQVSSVARMRPRSGGFALEVPDGGGKGGLTFKLSPKGTNADLTTFSCRSTASGKDDIFNPQFLKDMRPFSVIRFMDWMKANKKQRMTWAERTTPASFSQTSLEGASVEYMVALANELNADPWFTLPLEADEAYYRNFATYVRDHLRPDRKAYVEVSNEVWNGMFQQAKMAQAAGQALYPDASPVEAGDYYYADRVRAVMGVWTDVYKGKPGRIVRVLATQVGSRRHPTAALSHKDTAKSVDAVAVAPYFGPAKGQPEPGVDATEYLLTHGDEFIDHSVQAGLVSKDIAGRYGLPLICYEGGPAYVSFSSRLKEAFAKAEHDPRIYGIYTSFLKRWQGEVGGLYVAFDSIAPRFGHRLYTGQPLEDAPKMRALVDFMRANRIARADPQ